MFLLVVAVIHYKSYRANLYASLFIGCFALIIIAECVCICRTAYEVESRAFFKNKFVCNLKVYKCLVKITQ